MDWSQQVVKLVQNDAFFPDVIKRELRPITDLINDKNFAHLKSENGSANMSLIVPWLSVLYDNYCQIFDLPCSNQGWGVGCGLDDKCPAVQWCLDDKQSTEGYICHLKSEC